MHRGINELKRNNVRRVIMEEATRGCGEKEKDTICANLKVPSVPPTDWSANNVIQIKYLVRVSEVFVSMNFEFLIMTML